MQDEPIPQTNYDALVQFLTNIVDDLDRLVTDELLDDEGSWVYDYNAWTAWQERAETLLDALGAAPDETLGRIRALQERILTLQNGILAALNEGIPTDPDEHPENNRAVGRLMVALYPDMYPTSADWMRSWDRDEDGNDLYNGPQE